MTAPDTSTAPTVPPVIGKRCRLRNGFVVGPIKAKPNLRYPFTVIYSGLTEPGWTEDGSFDVDIMNHEYDIVAVLSDAGDGETGNSPDAAPITGYCFGSSQFFAHGGCIFIYVRRQILRPIPLAEARALLQVLPALIEIAEGQA